TLSKKIKDGLNAFWKALNEKGYTNHGVYTYEYYGYREEVIATVGKEKTWIAQYPFSPVRGGSYENKWRNEGYGAWQFSSTSYFKGNPLDASIDFKGLLTKSISKPSEPQGKWVQENGRTKYLINGKEQTGQQRIDGKWYLFDNKGTMLTGFQYIKSHNKT